MRKFLFLALLLGAFHSCQDDPIEPTTPTPTPTPTPNSYFISFKVDGVSYSYVNGVNSYSVATTTSGGPNIGNNTEEVGTYGYLVAFDPITDLPLAYGSVGFDNYIFNLQTYSDDEAAALASITSLGSFPFVSDGSVNPGAVIEFFDGTQLWSSVKGAQPASSSFVVTESSVFTDGSFDVLRRLKGTFNGTVYSEDGTQSKIVTDGTYHLIFKAT